MQKKSAILSLALIGTLGACETTERQLIFASSDTLGITIAGAAAETGAEFTLGYKGRDLVVMPSYAEVSDETAVGVESITAQADGVTDALSVYSHFNANTPIGFESTEGVGLGKVFATGPAAQIASRGVACALILNSLPGNTTFTNFDPSACLPFGAANPPQEDTPEE